MDPGDHNEGEKHHLRNFIAMRVKFFSRILSSTLWQKLSRKLISWSQLMIQSKWWEVGRIIPYDFVMYDLYFCHFKTYEILHSALRHPVEFEKPLFFSKIQEFKYSSILKEQRQEIFRSTELRASLSISLKWCAKFVKALVREMFTSSTF